MVEAVIWDFGGVLTTSPFEAFARFEKERGLPVDIIRRTNAANHFENAWAKFERAEVDLAAFDTLFAAESLALGAEVRGRDVVPLLSGDPRPEMVEALRRWSRSWDRPTAVVPMPSRRYPQLVGSVAEHLARIGRLPLVPALEVTGPPPSAEVSSAVRVRELLARTALRPGVELDGPVLLVDDVIRTRWTVTVASALLVQAGAAAGRMLASPTRMRRSSCRRAVFRRRSRPANASGLISSGPFRK